MYALYNQATQGDNTADDPCGFLSHMLSSANTKEHNRWKAWENLKGMEKTDAKKEYVQLVNKIKWLWDKKIYII